MNDSPPLKIAITGASGLIGSALSSFLQKQGHVVIPLAREKLEQDKLENLDVLINLAGENISSGLWSEKKKKKIYESRVSGTKKLVSSLNALHSPPKVFISASAIGYYGIDPKDPCTEASSSGEGFLASVCRKWESEANLFTKGRTVTPRFGIVLSKSGGALAKMLPIFRMGLGGTVAGGKQWVSWIAMKDLIQALYKIILDERLSGPVNLCTPNPVTNDQLTKILGKVLQRPTVLPVPGLIIRLLLGQMGKETILSSCRAFPKALESAGYRFAYPSIQEALKQILR